MRWAFRSSLCAEPFQIITSSMSKIRISSRAIENIMRIHFTNHNEQYYSNTCIIWLKNLFTQPKDVDVLLNNPKEAMAKAYDIVLNGYEIGGGSLRIYSQDVQQLMFKTLGLTDEDVKHRFGFFVDALKYGTPPHGGLALGLDRIVMLMTHTSNIKDVVAFPKTQSAKDQMMQAPSDVDEVQLEELHLKIRGE